MYRSRWKVSDTLPKTQYQPTCGKAHPKQTASTFRLRKARPSKLRHVPRYQKPFDHRVLTDCHRYRRSKREKHGVHAGDVWLGMDYSFPLICNGQARSGKLSWSVFAGKPLVVECTHAWSSHAQSCESDLARFWNSINQLHRKYSKKRLMHKVRWWSV